MLPLSASCLLVCGVLLGVVVDEEEEELRWWECLSLRRVNGGLMGR